MIQLARALTLALACLVPALAHAEDWAEAEAFYRREGHSEALALRARAFFRLATAGEGKGIPLLVERYRSPRGPHEEEERFLMAGGLRYAGRDDATQRAIDGWLGAARGRDPWLEFNALLTRAGEPLFAIARDPKAPAWRRAAAIQAIALGESAVEPAIEALAAIASDADALPRKDDDLHLLSGALGAALLDLQVKVELDPYGELDRDACAPLVGALMGLLKHPKLSEASVALLERRLSQFGRQSDDAGEEADEGASRVRGGSKRVPAEFMGVTVANCRRIVYVIDLSDSMLEPLTVTERDELTRRAERARTGGGSQVRKVRERLDWSRITTRFEAARAFLKMSLAELDDEVSFAVVGFGDGAELLRSTPKLTRAKGSAVARVAAELDALQPQRYADRDREGLWGNTNLHAAMRLAFRVSTRGLLSAEKCAAPGTKTESVADTIFLLSDGAPTRDDYAGKGPETDVEKGSWTEVDPETGKKTTHTSDGGRGHSLHDGPYEDLEFCRPDMERMNLFRWTQMHVVGIGECDRYWGQAVTEIGEGELQIIGKSAKD